MDPISSLFWNVFQNVLGNRVDAYLFGAKNAAEPPNVDRDERASEADDEVDSPAMPRRFESFDARYDIERLLTYVEQPVVHLLVEDQPSTAYNLPGYVLESKTTGEWFVFSRGRLALEGTGGGYQNMEGVIKILRAKDAKIVGWVIRKSDMDRLEDGRLLWPEARRDLIPLLSYHVDDERWKWAAMKREFDKLTRKSA
ncbi:hypothetical protein [Collimonas silvisoli]|uniref:hypothetical protein n=1 Tax=Collimonas silvisoli TaxID=2825884 RepID=UPI001B8C9A0D|nr:hypothetical protein [Collimonas silvisoli]